MTQGNQKECDICKKEVIILICKKNVIIVRGRAHIT